MNGSCQSSHSRVQNRHQALLPRNYFHLKNSSPQAKCFKALATLSLFLCQMFRRTTFTSSIISNVQTRYFKNILANHTHFLYIPLLRICTRANSSCEPLVCRTESQDDVLSITTISNYSSLGHTFILPTYPH